MKIFAKINILTAGVALLLVGIPSLGNAHSFFQLRLADQTGQSQQWLQTDQPIDISNSPLLSKSEVDQIVLSVEPPAPREILNQLSTTSLHALLPNIVSSIPNLASGETKAFSVVVVTAEPHSVLEEHSMKVTVTYEPRPVGGIMNVRVELLPAFSGVGVVNHAVLSKSSAEAVDELNPLTVSLVVAKLTKELTADFITQR
ncbi:MAG: hypothetical protein ABI444_12835 [Candidatus Kapaibacterium sp.]|jgi:hypothetical protein